MKRHSFFWWLLLIIAFILPLSQFICVRLIFVTLLFSFFVKKEKSQLSSLFTNVWDVALFFLVMLIGLAYTEDLKFGLSVFETRFSLFAFPFIFYKISDFDKKKLHQLFYVFALGLIIASFICISHAFVNYIEIKNVHVFFFYELTDVLDYQPTYFAYYIIFVISFGFYLLYFDTIAHYQWMFVALLFLFVVLMLTGGLTSFMSILLVLSFFVLKFLTDYKTKIKTQAFAIILLMLASLFMFSHLYKKLDDPSYKITDQWERVTLWESALNANSNVWLGVGTGDYKNEMNRFYEQHQMSAFENYNSHNQFLETLFSNGLIGLFSILILIGRPLYLSVHNQNVLGVLTFFPFLIYGVTEVFLGRFQGVVFFALLHQTFLSLYNNRTTSVVD